MTNTGWRGSFYCVLLINVLVIAVCIMLALDRTVPQFTAADEAAASRLLLLLIDGVLLFLVDLTYFLTQFLNPGIIDPT